MNEQEELWAGDFGKAYLERNQVEVASRIDFWAGIVKQTNARTALEVGCSRGHNMIALKSLGVPTVLGIDINEAAVKEARSNGLLVMCGKPVMAPLFGPSFDLTMTVGCLIHIAPTELFNAMDCLVAASKAWVLAVEYNADFETEVTYRGHESALWKRNYGGLYVSRYGLDLVDVGDLGPQDGFDHTRYWLMRKK